MRWGSLALGLLGLLSLPAFATAKAAFPSYSIVPGVCKPTRQDRITISDNVFSRGRQFYRHLVLDEERNVLYVGAMNHLYKLWMFNINDTDNQAFHAERSLEPSADAVAKCAYRSRDPGFHCQNHVRVLFRLADDSLYVCSTNAYVPAVARLDGDSLEALEDGLSGAAICPVDPGDNGTAVWVPDGNPAGLPSVYAAAVTDSTQTNRIIYRPPLIDAQGDVLHPFMRTVHTDSKWLNEPNFVGSLHRGPYVYFFFRENAVEFSNCGKAIYSRVARICKNDVGGRYLLKQNWATYIKARLNCSLPGNYPFYFDEIQHIEEVDGTVYGIFTTGDVGFTGSAVCAMSLSDIDAVLDSGLFKVQERSEMAWQAVLPSAVPSPRPGQCPTPGRPLSDTALHFIKTHPLLHDSVPSLGHRPLFHLPDRTLTRIAVDPLSPDTHVLFLGDTEGRLLKLLYRPESGLTASPLASYSLPRPQPIRALQLLPKEFLYVGTDDGVSQVELGQCSVYDTCAACSSDPYCAWNNIAQQCRRTKDTFRMTTGWVVLDGEEQCSGGSVETVRSRTLYPGDSTHLPCDGAGLWTKDAQTLALPSARHFLTVQGGLILLNISRSDDGTYDCFRNDELLASFRIRVDYSNCEKPTSATEFVSVYREWCREFQEYKSTMLKWKEWYSSKGLEAQCVAAIGAGANGSEEKGLQGRL